MSVLEDSINNLITTLRDLSSKYRQDATSLVDAADNVIKGVKTPGVPKLEYDVNRQFAGVERVPIPPKVKNVSNLKLPIMDTLQPIMGINDTFTTKAPTFTWPRFAYSSITTVEDFTEKPAKITPLTIKYPDVKFGPFAPPTLTTPKVITVDDIRLTPPTITPLVIDDFPIDSIDLLTPYKEQLDKILVDFSEWRNWLSQQETAAKELSGIIGEKLRKVVTGENSALTDTWENQTYQQETHAILMQRYIDLVSLDKIPGNATGLPTGVRDYARLTVELQALQKTMEASAKTAGVRYQEEVKHLQWALELSLKWSEMLANLFTDLQAWRLQGVEIALDGAEAALAAAVKVLQLKEKELELRTLYNNIQLNRLNLMVKIEKTKLEKLQIKIDNNKLIAVYNEHQIKIDSAAVTYVNNQLELFNSRITYLLAQQEWEELNYASFEADVKAYQARVNAMRAEQNGLKARIKGDLAKADTELAKAKVYVAGLMEKEATAKSLLVKTKAQAATAQQVLTAYNAKNSASLSWLKEVDSVVSLALRAIIRELNAEVQVEQIKLSDQELKDQDRLITAWQKLKENQLESMKVIDGYSLMVTQAKAAGNIIAQGSGTLGSLSQAAYSGLNAIGAREIIEEA